MRRLISAALILFMLLAQPGLSALASEESALPEEEPVLPTEEPLVPLPEEEPVPPIEADPDVPAEEAPPAPLPEEIPEVPAEEPSALPAEEEDESPAEELPAPLPTEEPDLPAEETDIPLPEEEADIPAEDEPADKPTDEPTQEPAEDVPDAPPEESPELPEEIPEDEPLPVLDGAAVSNAFPFLDVSDSAWYADAVRNAYYRQLMYGVSGSLFAPEGTMTRAMVVTVLWRLAGSPAPAAASGFTDLTQDWYQDAVAWARETGVTTGATEDTFLPDDPITREQMAAFLARFAAGIRGVDTAASGNLTGFPDRDEVSDYAREPLAWAVSLGIINGVGTGGEALLAPRDSATRAQVAAILMRFCQNLPESGDTTSLAWLVDHTAVAGRTNQIVAVVDHNLTLWERSDGGWSKTMDVYAGYGANGMSDDRTEGDMTTPIGAFPLLYAFGRDDDPGTAMTYRKITPTSYYSAEMDSTYNTWVESDTPVEGERLMDFANLQYRYAVVIGFNMDPVVLGKGSAIFLHCKGATWRTGGCVSVTQENMLEILDRLNQGAWIIIVRKTADLSDY